MSLPALRLTAPSTPVRGLAEPLPPARDPEPLERYELLRILGRGGMGEVRLVHDRRLARVVAMKTLRHDAPYSRARADRLIREALVQARLQHPAIVPVYDLGHGPGGQPYFTMKRVRGVTLASLLRDLRCARAGERLRRRLLDAFGTICQAVAYAHHAGVVHRDLKPDNVMLGEFGEVWVLDWGVAKVLTDQRERPDDDDLMPFPESLDVTQEGDFTGTPGYMPPEQIRDEADVDGRADVYSLGATLYEILTLEPLHAGNTVQQVIAATMRGVDPRRHARAAWSAELEEVCLRATAQRPADRFAGARELCAAFDRALPR